MLTMGELVRIKRERQGMDIPHFADKLEVSKQHVSNMENGRRTIPCSLLPTMARCLNCSDLLKMRMGECPVMAAMRQQEKLAA